MRTRLREQCRGRPPRRTSASRSTTTSILIASTSASLSSTRQRKRFFARCRRAARRPYIDFGRVDADSTRFNIVFPSTFGSDRRKPVTAEFQQFCETVYWPLVSVFLFGRAGWSSLRRHLTSFKVNTLRISEDEFYYGLPIYHFHLDHKIGQPAPKDECQLNTCRMIFSIVPAALEAGAAPEHDSTVYLRRQPPHGFTKQEALHTYLKTRFPEVPGPRPAAAALRGERRRALWRAPPGEVLLHHSHPGRPVHAEKNPIQGRGLYVLDWTDLRNAAPDGARRPATRMPMGEILKQLRVLAADPAGEAYAREAGRDARVRRRAARRRRAVPGWAAGARGGAAESRTL